jgi:hypothetical protein
MTAGHGVVLQKVAASGMVGMFGVDRVVYAVCESIQQRYVMTQSYQCGGFHVIVGHYMASKSKLSWPSANSGPLVQKTGGAVWFPCLVCAQGHIQGATQHCFAVHPPLHMKIRSQSASVAYAFGAW